MEKILVIDDSADIRTLVTETLRGKGYDALCADDGTAGLELARRHLPDLILCNVRMPNMDGYETLSALHADPLTATIPFIFLSGVGDKLHVRQGMELGADDYLTKPFTIPELLKTVRTRLERKAELTRQAEKKLEELRSGISMALPHELITPLNGILGFSSLLIEHHRVLPPEEIRAFANSIQQAARRLQRVIENFLVYSQMQLLAAGPDRSPPLLSEESGPLREVLQRTARQRAAAYHRESDLCVDLPCEIQVSMGADKVEKVVWEIVDNAFKFSKPGSPVRLTSQPKGGSNMLVVSDQGRGMTSEQLRRIGAHMQFDRQVYEQQGLGLGLVIAQRLTELHGGQFEIESLPGAGTTVRAALPISPAGREAAISA